MAGGHEAVSGASRLASQVLPVADLNADQARGMYRLYHRYYAGGSHRQFSQDLQQKDYCLLLEDGDGDIRGFTTLAISEHAIRNQRLRCLFSGDTIIHHEYWGEQTLPRAWCQLAGQIKAQEPTLPLYWLLIVKGHRTYRYLKVFSRQYFPAAQQQTPPGIKTIMETLAKDRFGQCYDTDTGVIRFPESRGYLRPEWAALDNNKKHKPEVAFFLQKNPGHGRGDELVCLTELDEHNLKRQALQAFRRGLST